MRQPNGNKRSGLGNATAVSRGVAVAIWLALSTAPSWSRAADERVRPPEDLPCSRDELTLYAGKVSRYARTKTTLDLTVETDWDTKESATLRAPDEAALVQRLRLDGKAFEVRDWARLEAAPGRLRDGVRVKVWLCRKGEDVTPARIDWEITSANTGARPGPAR